MLRSHALRLSPPLSPHGSSATLRYQGVALEGRASRCISTTLVRTGGPASWPRWPRWPQRHARLGVQASSQAPSGQETEGEGPSWSVASAGFSLPSQHRSLLNVVLVTPLIPGNVGSIARTCAASAVGLHLVEPLGFQVDDAKLKRAGLDYWPFVVVKVHSSWADFFRYFEDQASPKRLIAYSKKGSRPHWSIEYQAGDWLLFGAETSGLPSEAVEACSRGEYAGGVARIPIDETYVRSLNLAVAAGVGVYEALRRINASEPLAHLGGGHTQPGKE